MNRFLTPLTNAIIERNGTIDKYIGDAIMAFWNAPLDDPQQEINACEPPWKCLLAQTSSIGSSSTRRTKMAGHTGRCTSGSG